MIKEFAVWNKMQPKTSQTQTLEALILVKSVKSVGSQEKGPTEGSFFNHQDILQATESLNPQMTANYSVNLQKIATFIFLSAKVVNVVAVSSSMAGGIHHSHRLSIGSKYCPGKGLLKQNYVSQKSA